MDTFPDFLCSCNEPQTDLHFPNSCPTLVGKAVGWVKEGNAGTESRIIIIIICYFISLKKEQMWCASEINIGNAQQSSKNVSAFTGLIK